jgi:hypothetical protein
MYKVINRFKEKHHDGRIYEVGDVYPAVGKKFVKARAEGLSKTHPIYGVAFLELVQGTPPGTSIEKTETTNKKGKEAPEKSDG